MRTYIIAAIIGALFGLALFGSSGLATERSHGTNSFDSDVDVTGDLDITGDATADSVTANYFYGGVFNGDGSNLRNVPSGATTLSLFFTNTPSSDLGGDGFRTLTQDIDELGDDNYLTNTVTTASAFIYNVVSKVNEPSITYLPAGVYDLHTHAYKSGTKEVILYYKVGIYNGADVTYIGTSSGAYLDTTESAFSIPVAISDTELAVTDRIVVSMFVAVSGLGVDPDVVLEVEGNSWSHILIAGPAISATTFLPSYINAVSTKGIQAANLAITPYYAGTIDNSYTIDFANGGLQTMTLTNTVATRFAFTNVVDGSLYALVLKQPVLANATTVWPPEVKWKDGNAHAFTNNNGAEDIIQLMVINSSDIKASYVTNFQ